MPENNSVENGRCDNINPCGYCQATKSLRLYPTQSIFGDNFRINRYLSCNAVFPAPRPTPKQLEIAYDDSYYGQGQQKFTTYIETVLDWFRQGRARRVGRYVKPPVKVLDIGCGNWLHLDPPRHLFFIGAADLISKMKDFGFVLAKQRHLSLEQNPFGFQQSLLNCVLSKRDVLFESLKNNDTYTKQHSRFSILLQKLFYVVTFGLFVLLAAIEASLKKGGTIEMIFKKQNS